MIFFTSDTHFGHKGIIPMCRQRYENNVEKMDHALVQAWNFAVKPEDTVYHLGDLSFTGLERTVANVGQLNGKIKLIPGNHDNPQMMHRLQDMNLLEVLPELVYLRLEHGVRIVLCHYPLYSWRNMQLGSYHFHGHCHGAVPVMGRRMDVGVDVGVMSFRPRSLDFLIDLLKGSSYVQVDHHTKNYDVV